MCAMRRGFRNYDLPPGPRGSSIRNSTLPRGDFAATSMVDGDLHFSDPFPLSARSARSAVGVSALLRRANVRHAQRLPKL